jgi:hypothetical protein
MSQDRSQLVIFSRKKNQHFAASSYYAFGKFSIVAASQLEKRRKGKRRGRRGRRRRRKRRKRRKRK